MRRPKTDGQVSEDQLFRAYGPVSSRQVEILDEVRELRQEVDRLSAQLDTALTTIIRIASGELTVLPSSTRVQVVDALDPCPSCGWIASHDDDCPIGLAT